MKYEVTRDQLFDALANTNIDDDAIRDNYSGRGMYGDECFGLVAENTRDLIEFVIGASAEIPDADEWLPGVRSDSLGLGTIFYWPSVTVAAVREPGEVV